MTYHRTSTCDTNRAETIVLSGVLYFTSGFSENRVAGSKFSLQCFVVHSSCPFSFGHCIVRPSN